MTINIPNKECLFRLVSISCVTNDSKGGGIKMLSLQVKSVLETPRTQKDS
jgi:hypothetical protein